MDKNSQLEDLTAKGAKKAQRTQEVENTFAQHIAATVRIVHRLNSSVYCYIGTLFPTFMGCFIALSMTIEIELSYNPLIEDFTRKGRKEGAKDARGWLAHGLQPVPNGNLTAN